MTRKRPLLYDKGEPVEVDAMDLKEAVPILLLSANFQRHRVQQASLGLLTQIMNNLDRLQLAVSLAGAAISDELRLNDDVEVNLQNYVADLEDNCDVLLKTVDSAGLSSYDKIIWTVWSSTFSAIERFHSSVPAVQLLTFLTYLHRACIQHELFRLSAIEYSKRSSRQTVSIPEWLQSILALCGTQDRQWDDHQYRETVRPLLRYGLVRAVKGPAGTRGLTMHSLVRWRVQQQADYGSYWEVYVAWMYLVLRDVASSIAAGQFHWIIPHLPSTRALRDDFLLPDPGHTCIVLQMFADIWKRTRRWHRAELLYTKLLLIGKVLDGDDLMLKFRHEIGDIQFHLKFQDEESSRSSDIRLRTEAARFIESIYESERVDLGDKHWMTLPTGTNLIGVYSRQGKVERMEELAVRLFETHLRLLGPQHLQTLMCALYAVSGRTGKAELLQVEKTQCTVLNIATEKLAPVDRLNVATTKQLAANYSKLERWSNAEDLYFKVIEIQASVLGVAHPDTLADMEKLAFLFDVRDSATKAAELRQSISDSLREHPEPEHLDEGIGWIVLFDPLVNPSLESQLGAEVEEEDLLKLDEDEIEADEFIYELPSPSPCSRSRT